MQMEQTKETVEVARELLDFDEVVRYMDPSLLFEARQWAGYGATAQAVLDEYAKLHRARYDEEFVPGALVAR